MAKAAKARNVVFVIYEGVQLLDVAGPAEVFAMAASCNDGNGYDLHYAGPRPAFCASSAGLQLAVTAFAELPHTIDLLVVPGGPVAAIERAFRDEALDRWLRAAAEKAERLASICTGSFALAALGLLDGRRATTHWSAIDRLARAAPKARIEREPLFVEDGRIWSSAGVSTGIDMALAMVARDLGPDVAIGVARELVLHLVRPGGQSQFSVPLALQGRSAPALSRLVPWIEARLHEPISVGKLAAAMGMSERTLHRQCVSELGLAPARLVAELRLERARMLLLEPSASLGRVAGQTGYSDAAALAKAFSKRFATSPAAYRRNFASAR